MFRKIIEKSKTQIIHTALLTFLVALTFNAFFFAKNTEALRVPALAVSFSSTPRINGTAIINSTTQTAEYLVAVTVYSDNLTGYQATISTEDNETAMTSVTNTDRIESISQNTPLANFPTNTWGIRLGGLWRFCSYSFSFHANDACPVGVQISNQYGLLSGERRFEVSF